MSRTSKIEHVVILNSKFNLEDRRVFFGRARLMPDRIVLKGLFYKRVVSLDAIQEVRWSSDLIVLGLRDGDELELIIQSAALWKFELQSRCGLTDNASTFPDPKRSEKPAGSTPAPSGLTPGDASSTEIPSVSPGRESTYRVKSHFAQDRPSND